MALLQLEEAVRIAPGLAEAHYRRGLFLARTADNGTGDMFQRARAGDALEQAARLNPTDPRPYLEMGRLRLKQGFMRLDAHRLFNRAREVATRADNPAVLAEVEAEVGDIYARRAMSFQGRRMITAGTTQFDAEAALADPNYAQDFLSDRTHAIDDAGELELRQAETHYRAGLAALPSNDRSAAGLLSLLYDAERIEEYFEASRAFSRAAPDQWRAQLFHGLGLWRMHRAREADRAFHRALELMPAIERNRAADLSLILRRTEAEAYARLTAAERQEFNRIYWSRSDPLRLSPENEHAIEHLARVAYTELRFAAPDLGLRGWDTDRGVIYIRYGPPPVWATFPPEIARGQSDPVAVGRLTTIWHYPERNLRFVFTGAPGYNFARFAGDFHTYAEDARYQVPVRYDNLPVGEALDSVPVQAVAFRATGDTTATELVLFAGIPLRRLAADVDLDEGVLETGMFITDRLERPVTERRTTETVRFDAERHVEQRTFVVHLNPGTYRYRVEARQPATRRAARGAADRMIESLVRPGLQVSDILLADRVAPRNEAEVPRSRADFFILPNAEMNYAPGDQVALYWEAYGATPDSVGAVRLDVEIIVTIQTLERRGTIARIVGGALDAVGASSEGDDRLALAYVIEEVLGDRDRLPIYLALELGNAPRGVYTLEIVLTDRISGQSTVRHRTFIVSDERDPS
jgi:GWxTD domain-containing protein